MKILVADKMEEWGLDQLRGLADQLSYEPELKDEALKQQLARFDPDILIVRSTKVPGPVLAAGRNLKLIIRAGSGVDTIDVQAATQRNVRVANCPGMNSIAVAELTMGHILNLDRRIADNVADLRRHKWDKKGYSKARGLKGSTLGIVGMGRIGTEVAKRALAFEMNVLWYDVIADLRPIEHPHCKRTDLDTLFRESDYISLHVPGTGQTRHLVNAERLKMMKPHACIINTSRASVVDESALLAALKAGTIRAAAVDVYENEPPADGKEIHSPLADLPNLYGTHHIGASTEQAQLAVAEETVRIVREYRQTGRAPNCVN